MDDYWNQSKLYHMNYAIWLDAVDIMNALFIQYRMCGIMQSVVKKTRALSCVEVN